MPIFAITLLLQIACVVHIMKTGRDRLWLLAVIFVPLIGIAAYALVEILPGMMRSRTVSRASSNVARGLDPGGSIRERRRALEITDTADNRRLLAQALSAAGRFDEAAALYESALSGALRDDPALLFGLAQARMGNGDFTGGLTALETLAALPGEIEPLEAPLLRAICLESVGRTAEALALYQSIAEKLPGEEARCRYARLLAASDRKTEAAGHFEEILKHAGQSDRRYRRANRVWIEEARSGLQALRASS